MAASKAVEVQREYFSLVERHLSGALAPLWRQFQQALARDPNVYEPEEWSRFFRPGASILVPDPLSPRNWSTSVRSHVFALAEDIAKFWAETAASLRDDLKRLDALSYYVPCRRIHEQTFVRSAMTCFDFVVFEDPLGRLLALFEARQTSLREVPEQYGFWSDVDRGTDLQLASSFFTLWWILQYRTSWPESADDLRFVVVPPTKEGHPFGLIPPNSPIAERVALKLLSDIAGDEFLSPADLLKVTHFEEKSIPWRTIAVANEILKDLFSTSAGPASEESVISTVTRLLTSQGFPAEELRRRDAPFGLHRYVGFGAYNWIRHRTGYLLDLLWQSSAVGADAGIGREEWPAHIWIMKFLSGGTLPENPVSPTQLGALTLQSERLTFLGHLSDEELAFIRSQDRLTEMRRSLCGEHNKLRNEIGRAPIRARESAQLFIAKLDQYEAELERMLADASRGIGRRIVRKARQDVAEIGLTGAVGVLGLVAAPPWSFLLTGLSAVVGGQSLRGVVKAAKEEAKKEQKSLEDLQQSPLSVCLNAKRRAEGTTSSRS